VPEYMLINLVPTMIGHGVFLLQEKSTFSFELTLTNNYETDLLF